jgi:hypothetical protein
VLYKWTEDTVPRISERKRLLKEALKNRDLEGLLWWVVREHYEHLLDPENVEAPPLPRGILNRSVDHLSKVHLKRLENPEHKSDGGEVAELENVLRLLQ